jgi:MoxR-like ATPase
MKSFPYYTGNPLESCATVPAEIPLLERDRDAEAQAYIADQGLADAVNVMLILGQPLLLTGEAGTGKTLLAYSVGCELGLEVLKFETKSTSTARDLFYTYDALGRFHAAQLQQGSLDSKDYVNYNALGTAVLRSRDASAIKRWIPQSFRHNGPERSIVLIDEIDKAPRDFPNDLLNEIEYLYFKVPELGLGDEVIAADRSRRPIIIITSNSEKNLPDAFLRRCIYFNITFPDNERLRNIVLSNLASFKDKEAQWLDDALDFFSKLREPNWGLDKRPATAELLNWLTYLRKRDVDVGKKLRAQSELVTSSLSALFKSADDQAKAKQILIEWVKET